ncbi:MAG: ABC transporter permease [Anaerolineales bacterium]|nr:ABC transporter permease [Anaerolineales bacterium]
MSSLQIALAVRYLWGRKLRTFLTTLAIMLGALVIFSMNILLPTMLKAFQANMLAASGQVDMTITHKSGEAFSEKALNNVKTVPGVRAVSGSLSRTVNIPANFYGRASVSALTLTGIDPRAAPTLRAYPVKEGRFLRSADALEAVITTSLAESLGLKLNDEMDLPTTEGTVKLEIVGLLPARTLPGNEEVLITLYEAQKLLDLPQRINTIEVNLDTTDQAQRDAIQRNIEAALGDDYTTGSLSSGAELLASIKTGQAAFNLFGFLALFMGGFIIFNTFRTIVAERRRDIGMLRAVGASRSTILGLVLTEGLLQGVFGTLAGMALGYLLGIGMLSWMSPVMNQFMHLEFSGVVVETSLVITTVALGVGVTLFAGLLPAINASRVTPLDALRPAVAEVSQRISRLGAITGFILITLAVLGLLSGEVSLITLGGLMFLVGMVLVAPALVRPVALVFSALIALAIAREGTGELAQGNLTRQPTRSAITASATMVGLAIIVAMGGLVWSLSGGFLDVLQKSLGSDYLVMPPSVGVWGSNVGAKPGLAEDLRRVPGVEAVSTFRVATTSANGKALSLLGIDPLEYPKVASLNFQEGEAGAAYASLAGGRTLIVNGMSATQAGLKVGDSVLLSTPTGSKEYHVVAVAYDYLNAKIMTAYTSQANLETDFRKDEDVFIQMNLSQGADPAVVEPKLKDILEDYPQFKLVSGKNYFEENRQLFDFIFVFYFVLLGVLALPSLIAMLNTLAIGVIERQREIGMLRAIGATRRQVRRMVVAESLLLAAIGTAFGLLAGLYLGYMMLLALGAGGFPVEYAFPYIGIVAAIATGLIFGVAAAVLPARQAARMDIIRALRYE